uniref:Uncharacterized protein n=1 Tax=Nelumbo nucifera TaxID=4432 RepID=A0A822YND7_NELNU|nr:TPA_asm: hypothetical protein HUJ06_011247 [Nelumbo nucifera]
MFFHWIGSTRSSLNCTSSHYQDLDQNIFTYTSNPSTSTRICIQNPWSFLSYPILSGSRQNQIVEETKCKTFFREMECPE